MKSCRLSGRPRRGVSIAVRDPIMQGASKPKDDSDSPDTPPPNDYSLQEVEQHFTELVAGVEDHAIFLLDPNGIVKSWNAGARRIKGYEAEEIIGQPFTRFYTQEAIDSGWPQEELRRAAATGRIQDEGWRLRKDGSRIWANVVITALRSPSGELRGFLKITRDLTERRQTEEILRLSEERLRLLIESVQDYAIFMLDPDGRIASWNLGAERIKGYTAAEIIGQHFSIFYSSEDVASGKPQRELETAIREGRVEDEGWRVRKDRSQFWANVIITSVYDRQGTLRGFAKITRDLTESHEANLAALESERQFRLVVQGVTDYAIYMLDPQGRVTNWNTGAERIKGYSSEEIVGEHFSRFYTPEDVEARIPWKAIETAKREGRFDSSA